MKVISFIFSALVIVASLTPNQPKFDLGSDQKSFRATKRPNAK